MRVILSGGLGNQLFKFMAAQKYLDQSSLEKLVLDVSWFSDENQENRASHNRFQLQNLIDNKKYFVRKTKFPILHEFLLRKINGLSISSLINLKILRDNVPSFIGDSLPRLVVGDFEDYKRLPEFETVDHILRQLDSDSEWKRNLVLRIKQENPIIMHVRLGDYLDYPEIYGFMNSNYYIEALKILKSKGVQRPLWLSSDNPDAAVKKFKGEIQIDYVLSPPVELEALQVMLAIAESRNLIIAHSTFSWWAAWISFHRNRDTNIVMPSRFLAHELEAERLQVPGWNVVGL
jgi:hypothetical protein